MNDYGIPLVKELAEAYREAFKKEENHPDWAVRKIIDGSSVVHPTVPFVGKNYCGQNKRILVYASAENLVWHYKDSKYDEEWLDDDETAINRHRKLFEETKDTRFFPLVHMAPMNNGYLSTAAYYIAKKLFRITDMTPKDFYETIAFANYGKFSIETQKQFNLRNGNGNCGDKKNLDYAYDPDKLKFSHKFVEADLSILKPDLIIIPKTVLDRDGEFKQAVINAKFGEKTAIIGISQMNARVINVHISGNKKYGVRSLNDLPSDIPLWQNELIVGEKSRNRFGHIYSYLDEVTENKQIW